MRILILSTLMIDLGSSKQSYRYVVESSIRAALSLGLDVTVLHYGSAIEGYDVNWVSIEARNKYSPGSFLLRYRYLKEAIRLSKRHDLVYVHNSSDMFNYPIVRASKATIIHYHDLVQDLISALFPVVGSPISSMYAIDTFLCKGSYALATSDIIAERLRKRGYKRVSLAYNRFGFVEPRESELSEFIEGLKRPVFVYVGTVQRKIKGLEDVDKIVGRIGGTLLIVGKKESEIRLENAIYYGQVDTLNELIGGIRHADFGVIGKIPAYILSTKIFDYIQAGLPIITHADNEAIVRFLRRLGRPFLAYKKPEEVRKEDLEGMERKSPDEVRMPETCEESVRKALKEVLNI